MAAATFPLSALLLFFSFSASSHAKPTTSTMGSPISSISAAPAFLPEAPSPSPLLSPYPSYSPGFPPDGSMLPEFPTPPRRGSRAGGVAPTSIITSVQSPPNPDEMVPDAGDDDGFFVLPPLGYSASVAADTSSSSRAAVASVVVVFLLFKSSLLLFFSC